MPASCPPRRFVESATSVGYSRPLECAVRRAIVCERRKPNRPWRGRGRSGRGAARRCCLAGRGRGPGDARGRDCPEAGGEGRHRRAVRPHPLREADDRASRTSFVSPPNGVFPFFGSVYSGGGFTLGAGYRRFYAREAVWEVKGLYSIKNYKLIEFGTRAPWNNNGRLTKGIRVGWRDAPQVGYYGTGMDAVKDDRANFRIKQTYLAGDLGFRPTSWTRLDARGVVRGHQERGRRRAQPRPSRPSTTPRPRRDSSST